MEEVSFGRIKEVFFPENLISIQLNSYEWFLQKETPPHERKNQGLQKLFVKLSGITDFNEKVILEFIEYSFGKPKLTEDECRSKGLTYSVPLRAKFRLIIKETGEIREQEVYMKEIPLMTERGNFIINGAERVVVNQIHRSPGIYYQYLREENLYFLRIIPYHGAWLEFEIDANNILYARLSKRRRILATTFLRALGYVSNKEIISLFSEKERTINVSKKTVGMRLAEDIILDEEEPVALAGDKITEELIDRLKEKNIVQIKVLDVDNLLIYPIINTLEKDDVSNLKKALIKIYSILKPGEPVNIDNVKSSIQKMFFDERSYDLGMVGRYKINKKLGLDILLSVVTLTKEDIIAGIKYLIGLASGEGKCDDIDHLGNRRVRSVGELLGNHLRPAFAKIEKGIREKMSVQDVETMTPQSVMNIRPLTASINEFFGTSQLSQFMDQTNPLSEITHKRRFSALGAGGLAKERAGFEVRDINPSHYGRLCPIETPEGPNIGLITSLSIYARPNEFGFLETPYFKVKNGRVTDEVVYLTADEEENYSIAYAGTPIDEQGYFKEKLIFVRKGEKFPLVPKEEVDFIDISPKQLISIATSLIPFLEHDDANRALMGSNMQRQAVPLLKTEVPLVMTGMERKVVKDSGMVVISDISGKVTKVTSDLIEITNENEKISYNLIKYKRSNQGTCINQRPVVKEGSFVKKGDIISDGPCICDGKLSLGRNILVAFMPWEGYNFEDAIVLSERVVIDDIFTSIYIERYEIDARDTQLGPETFTRDIPNVGEEALKNLDENGIIRIGAIIKPGDILVGKVTPKGEKGLSPEYKLLYSIFGEKVKDVRDTSLKMPYGDSGIVIGIEHFSQSKGDSLPIGIEEMAKIYVAKRRKITVGDKMAGRHGNKGVIAKILPIEDMPFLPDGTPVDIVLNPLSVPSRMNLGQILEAYLGWAAHKLGFYAICPVFDSPSEEEIEDFLEKAGFSKDGKTILHNGKTGEFFNDKVSCGYIYMLKLVHLVEDKIHARSIGPYSLVTQQPLGGKAQFGGQRFGEMEVWALEAYGTSHILQELLTVKSDDVIGRTKAYGAIVKGENAKPPGIPESFKVLTYELRGLGLDINVLDEKGRIIDINSIFEEKEDVFTPFGRRE
ncbi:TPA: DNA-directed RNA polymerase subunit beta [bacterium]|nr:DNA-directed RNA polymerase subunit beta [bacterium]